MRELLSVNIDDFLGKKSQDTRWVFDRYPLGGYNGGKNNMRHFGKNGMPALVGVLFSEMPHGM
jgi:hypothetical protein